MSYIRTFHEISAEDIHLVGSKGANLGELVAAGFPVPPGFCVTTQAYCTFVAANGIQPEILRVANLLQANAPDLLEATSDRIRDLFIQGQFPSDLAAEIQSAYACLAAPPVAVRSSATSEDLVTASFTGQHETYLNVREWITC